MITGRTLDAAGEPIPGTGFDVDPESELGRLLAERTGPLTSHPTQPVWSVPLESPDPDVMRSLSVMGPGYGGPPEHYHEHSVERFDVRGGELVFTVDGVDRRAGPGDVVTVEPGERHGFRVDGDGLTYAVVDVHDPGRLRYVLPTLGGIAHDDAVDEESTLQGVAIARALEGNTVFTDTDPRVAGPLTRLLDPVARLGGYQGAYGTYMQPAFWREHVEQPPF